MQALTTALNPRYYAPSAFANLSKESLTISKIALAALYFLTKYSQDVVSIREITVFVILVGIAYSIIIKITGNSTPKEIRVLRTLPKLEQRGFASIKGDRTFTISKPLYPDFLKLLHFCENALPPMMNKEFRGAILKPSQREYDHRFQNLRQILTGVYSVKGSEVKRLYYVLGSSDDRGLVISNEFLRTLLLATLKMLPGYKPKSTIKIQALLTRHTTSVPFLAVHKDGFNGWLIQYNLDYSQKGISGGRYQIIEEDRVVKEDLASSLLDGYILDDKKYFHSATAINIEEGSNAQRLIIIFRTHIDNSTQPTLGKRLPPLPKNFLEST